MTTSVQHALEQPIISALSVGEAISNLQPSAIWSALTIILETLQAGIVKLASLDAESVWTVRKQGAHNAPTPTSFTTEPVSKLVPHAHSRRPPASPVVNARVTRFIVFFKQL